MLTWSTILSIAVKGLGVLHYTLIPSHCIQVDMERLLFSLAVKWHKIWSPQIDKKVINSVTKCLISVKIAILTPHIIPLPLVNVWLIFDLQKYVNWLCVFLEVKPCFQKAHFFCMDSCRSIQCCMYDSGSDRRQYCQSITSIAKLSSHFMICVIFNSEFPITKFLQGLTVFTTLL